ncbi:MAG: Rieske 2Fe-2S domain-containing protein, partial [Stellaceae bacterium]
MRALNNQWYCAAFGHELKTEPLARTICNEPVVLYRKSDGAPVAFEDRCCHRRAPLSKGRVEGDHLRCGYHGLLYEPSGAAIWAPGQDRMPPGARVRSYPVVESHGWIWLWTGDPALAERTPAPCYDKYDDPNWAAYDQHLPVKANYFLVVDNLLDLSHLPFLHANTIGSPEDTDPNLTWERGPNWVKGARIARG